MPDKILFRRGLFSDLPDLDEGEPGLITDTGTVYVGAAGSDNILLNPVQLVNDSYHIDGYLSPTTDNVHGLGTPTNRWRHLIVGPGSLHLVSQVGEPAGDTEWICRIDDNGGLVILEKGQAVPIITMDSSQDTAFAGAVTAAGNVTTAGNMTAVNATFTGNITANSMQQYISVNLETQNSNQTGTFHPWNTDAYGGAVTTYASNGITLATSTGRFTVSVAGLYKISLSNLITTSSGTPDTYKVRKNTSAVWDRSGDGLQSPLAINLILSLSAGDFIDIELDSGGAATMRLQRGSTFVMERIA